MNRKSGTAIFQNEMYQILWFIGQAEDLQFGSLRHLMNQQISKVSQIGLVAQALAM